MIGCLTKEWIKVILLSVQYYIILELVNSLSLSACIISGLIADLIKVIISPNTLKALLLISG